MGYATGQFGKNHLGDLNQFLPTVHGFDEFFGYLYHLDAMEDPAHPNYPQELLRHGRPTQHGPFLGDRAGRSDRAAAMGQNRQAEDRGRRHALSRSAWRPWTTRFLAATLKFIDKARKDGNPFFVWFNPTRMHMVTHLSPKYQALRNSKNGWSIEEAGMAQLDDIVGSVMKNLKDNGLDDEHHGRVHHRQRPENFTWPDGGQTPFDGARAPATKAGSVVPR